MILSYCVVLLLSGVVFLPFSNIFLQFMIKVCTSNKWKWHMTWRQSVLFTFRIDGDYIKVLTFMLRRHVRDFQTVYSYLLLTRLSLLRRQHALLSSVLFISWLIIEKISKKRYFKLRFVFFFSVGFIMLLGTTRNIT